jgi:hypothetical protein
MNPWAEVIKGAQHGPKNPQSRGRQVIMFGFIIATFIITTWHAIDGCISVLPCIWSLQLATKNKFSWRSHHDTITFFIAPSALDSILQTHQSCMSQNQQIGKLLSTQYSVHVCHDFYHGTMWVSKSIWLNSKCNAIEHSEFFFR